MNAIMGCPFLLPTVRLNDIPSQLLAVTINCCIESVNIFANRMALLATSKAVRRNILDHPLASTFVCRLIQIATLRFCMHTLLLSKSRDAALSAATLDMPKPASETLKTMTYDPDFVALPLARRATCPPSVKSVLLRKKAANTSTGDMKKRACATSRDLSRRGDEGDSSEDTDSSSTGGTTELDNDDPETMAVNRQAEKTGNTGVGTMSEKYSGLVFDPLLISMTICFRELELAAILIGLQSPLQPPRDFKFPQATDDILELPISEAINSIHDISKVKHAGKEKPLDVHLDWITIFYLLHDLKLKVDHMFGADLRHVTGWYAFERLDALSTPLRQLYLLALIPCLVNIVNSLTLYFKDVSGEETEEDHFVNLPRSQSNLFLGDCLSAGIYCLTALSTGIPPSVNLLRSPEALISRAQNLSNACLSRLRHLAVCLDDHRLAPVTVAKTIIGQGQLPAISMLDEDELELSTIGKPTSVSEEANDQNIPHKDYLCAIVAMHLHSPFFGPCSTPVDDCLGIFLNLIKSNLLPILLQQPKNQVDPCGHLRYSNLTSHNVGMYGKKLLEALCRQVVICVRKLAKQTMNAGKSTSVIDLLTQWNSCVGTLVSITDVTKDACGGDIPPSRAFFDLLPGLMRTGRVFLENLLRCAMPFFNALFRTHASEVLAFLRNVQQLTRFLQRTCVHAKTRREARLTPLIPQTRKCLEAFVYSVKLLLSQNKCVDAFWLGNLKNRDLSGQEVGFKELSTRHSTQISGASAGSSLPGSQVTGGFSIEVDEHDEETESSRDAIANAKSDIEDDDVEESTDISDDYEEDDGDGKEIF
ncbi:unnamed protein product [Mesocestoides corti]|uniref:Uncharacterized protein n=1 Tax=Mesocestoides corti TaxID=53468 RepID=A0A158QVV7_MESCO|nr:unnamed protein product [Mesocestoides corti]